MCFANIKNSGNLYSHFGVSKFGYKRQTQFSNGLEKNSVYWGIGPCEYGIFYEILWNLLPSGIAYRIKASIFELWETLPESDWYDSFIEDILRRLISRARIKEIGQSPQ